MNSSRRIITVYLFIATLILLCRPAAFAQGPPAPRPQRIVSLAPSVTETLFALGFGDRLVGVTTYCDYPAEARRLPKIGDFLSPSLEAIIAKRPDLVIGVNGATDPVKARELERLGLKVTLISVASLNDILNSIKSIARLLGSPEAGERLVTKIGAQVQDVKHGIAAAPRRPVLLVVGIRPLVAVGGKNFIDEMITLAGGKNIAGNAAQPWLNLPTEYVVAKAPQVIIEAGMGSEREQSGKRWEDLKSIPAVKERRIYYYRSDKILRPGPRFGEAIAELARLIHPECFANFLSGKRNVESRCESP
ncbi:MAG: cobalamin-binding protein [Candidatus Binatia bacterium]